MKISIESSEAMTTTPAATNLRVVVDSIKAKAIAKKLNEKPGIVANLERKSSVYYSL